MRFARRERSGDHLVLIGPMGAGKSSLARQLARLTSRRWVDTDKMIVNRVGLSITEIFERFGEEEFRDRESEVLRGLVAESRLVIATGGGIVVRPDNHALLRGLGCVIFLLGYPEVLFERVSRNQRRPLLHTANPEQTLRDLLAARQPIYTACADLVLDTSEGTHERLAEEVLSQVWEFFS